MIIRVYISWLYIYVAASRSIVRADKSQGWNNRHQVISSELNSDGAIGIKLAADKVRLYLVWDQARNIPNSVLLGNESKEKSDKNPVYCCLLILPTRK